MDLTRSEEQLIEKYSQDFFSITGKKLEMRVLDKWESLCKLKENISTTRLINLICGAMDWNPDDILVAEKTDKLVLKRSVIYFILKCNGVSFKKIGMISGKDHTTIMKALKNFEIQLDQDKYIGILLREIMQSVNESL